MQRGAPLIRPRNMWRCWTPRRHRAYQQIGVIDVAGEPGAFRSQVLAQVAQRARQMGADAVILQDVKPNGSAETKA